MLKITHPWTAEEKQLIRDTLDIPPRKLIELFPGRDSRGIIDQRKAIRTIKPTKGKTKKFNGVDGELWQILGGWNYDSLPNISD